MPSKYHMEDLTPREVNRYIKAMLHDEQVPALQKKWDYQEWAKKEARILETEKRVHMNIQRLAEKFKQDKEIYEMECIKGQWDAEAGKLAKYSPMVKVGNWQEQRDVAEEDLNRFLRLRERGQLMIQKTREIIGQNLKPMTLPPKKFVRFEEKVQLIAGQAKTYKERGRQEGLSLSCVLTGYATAEMCQPLIEGTVLSASPLIAPCIRNVFQLLPWDKEQMAKDDRLKYGQDFVLRYIGTPETQPYYVSVNPRRIIPSGNNSQHPEVHLHSRKCWANVWRAYHADTHRRKATIGQPIPGNQDVILTSANINRCLCCETECWFTTFFGLECEATAYTYYNIYGNETPNNIWYFN